MKGPDGVRARNGQRLEFEYSTQLTTSPYRIATEAIVQRNLQTIGIKFDIQNYPQDTFFGHFLSGGKASPSTGALAGRFDIAEYAWGLWYDPDDSGLLSCDPALDVLYKQELATADAGMRQQTFRQIHEIYLTQLPFITLYSWTYVSIMHKGTHNYQQSPFEANLYIWEWWCDNGKC